MTLSVIGAGFGRTGTNSLKLALEQLGFGPCHHMFEVIQAQETVPEWHRAVQGHTVDWDTLFKGFNAQVDWPGALFWRQLLDWAPNAKVILSVRDEEAWFKSITNTIFAARVEPDLIRDPKQRAFQAMVNDLADTAIGSLDRDRETVLAAYRRNIQDVQQCVPADQLLTFDVKEGWEPLCQFLGVAVPVTPFPRTNDTASFRAGHPHLTQNDRT